MASPVTRGTPRDWRVGAQAPNNAAQLKRRQTLNETQPCQCPGCTGPDGRPRNRAGVSRYCGPHRDEASRNGDPLARLPARNELVILKKAMAIYLETNPRLAKQVDGDLKALDARKVLPRSFMLGPSDIHRGLPQIAKAHGLLANWQHKHGRSYTEAVTHAMALIGWMAIYYGNTGSPRSAGGFSENRERFLQTRAGALLGDFRKTIGTTTLIKDVSGATRRHLGRDFIRNAREIYGKDFWSSPVSTVDGQDMTILDYAKAALRAAKLL